MVIRSSDRAVTHGQVTPTPRHGVKQTTEVPKSRDAFLQFTKQLYAAKLLFSLAPGEIDRCRSMR
eukprot:1301015-Prymnesium_polylepis.1